MKIFNKRRLPHNLRILGSHILKNSFNPFSLKSRLNSPSKVSDFFIWSPNFKKIEFIAENINALLSAEEKEVLHEFIFYNKKTAIKTSINTTAIEPQSTNLVKLFQVFL